MRIFPSRSAISVLIVGLLCFKRSGNQQEIHHSDLETGWQFVSPALPTNSSTKKHIINSFVFKSWKFVDHPTFFPPALHPKNLQPYLPLQVDVEDTSLGHQNIFGSEFGSVVMSSFESMAPTLAPEHWGLHGGRRRPPCHKGASMGGHGGPWISVFFFC